jgi:putative hydrolase of the HAD superfamily
VRYTTVFFDLDDTLYPASSGLWPTLKNRMNLYMIERMGFPPQQVPVLREKYFRQYGTTLRGLQANHDIDVQDFLAFVHDVKLRDFIQPDPVQQQVLASLGTRNVIFTNADRNHAQRVIDVLEIAPYFAAVVDVNAMEPYCKPNPEAFALAMKTAGETDPSRCVMIDDLEHTTLAARSLGMYSLLYGAASGGQSADAAFNDWRVLPSLLNGDHA